MLVFKDKHCEELISQTRSASEPDDVELPLRNGSPRKSV